MSSWFEKNGFQRWDNRSGKQSKGRLDFSEKAGIAILISFVCLVPVAFKTIAKAKADREQASQPVASQKEANPPQGVEAQPPVALASPETEQTAERVFKAVSPSVVVVRCGSSQGSGVVIGQGMVVSQRQKSRGL
jgi:hypothetical protein